MSRNLDFTAAQKALARKRFLQLGNVFWINVRTLTGLRHSQAHGTREISTSQLYVRNIPLGSGEAVLLKNQRQSSLRSSSDEAFVGDSYYMFAPREMKRDCNYIMYGPYPPSGVVTWSSTNTPVVTVDGGGNETAIASGDANILAHWQTVVGYNYSCAAIYANVQASATCHVCTKPSGEVTQSSNWDDAHNLPTAQVYQATLLPTTTDFSGR
jgi:hypothetical protein